MRRTKRQAQREKAKARQVARALDRRGSAIGIIMQQQFEQAHVMGLAFSRHMNNVLKEIIESTAIPESILLGKKPEKKP